MTTLLVADHDGRTMKDTTTRALTAACSLGEDVHILVAGKDCGPAAERAATLVGVARVLLCDNDALAHQLPEPIAALVVTLSGSYNAIVAPASALGKSVMPRVAALLDVGQVSEVIRIVGPETFERPIYAGNAVQTVSTGGAKKVLTIRTAAFASSRVGDATAPIEELAPPLPSTSSFFVGAEPTRSERSQLGDARIVVSGGRAFRSSADFKAYLEPLADKLNAAIGASRAAVDAGFAASDLQVGQSGKIVAPELYIACGISGAIQHIAGMKESKVIVAINQDEAAPIFQLADYWLVGDIFQILPELEKLL